MGIKYLKLETFLKKVTLITKLHFYISADDDDAFNAVIVMHLQ